MIYQLTISYTDEDPNESWMQQWYYETREEAIAAKTLLREDDHLVDLKIKEVKSFPKGTRFKKVPGFCYKSVKY